LFRRGCSHSAKSAPKTETTRATFVSGGSHTIQVQQPTHGAFTNQTVMPLDRKVKITAGGKDTTIDKLKPGTPLTIKRDVITHKVTEIEAD
jgi:hypothetical protein